MIIKRALFARVVCKLRWSARGLATVIFYIRDIPAPVHLNFDLRSGLRGPLRVPPAGAVNATPILLRYRIITKKLSAQDANSSQV